MNSVMRRIIMERRNKGRDYRRMDRNYDYGYDDRRMDYGRGEYRGNMEYRGDYESDYNDYDDNEMPMDGRRGVKGTGRYGIGGSRYYGRRRDRADEDYERPMNDYRGGNYRGMDYAGGDYKQGEMRLSKRDMMMWKERMENPDGSYGEHFPPMQIKQVAQQMGIQMQGYSDKELCLAANMLYSDYSEAIRQFAPIPKEKEPMLYVAMARAFLEDPDASVQGSEKLAAYYYAIVDDDDE